MPKTIKYTKGNFELAIVSDSIGHEVTVISWADLVVHEQFSRMTKDEFELFVMAYGKGWHQALYTRSEREKKLTNIKEEK